MDNLNIPPFYVGQTAEYITGIAMPKHSKHTVTEVYREPCGCWGIQINNTFLDEGMFEIGELVECEECGKEYKNVRTYNFWSPYSFRPIQEQTFPLITLSQIKVKETEKEFDKQLI